MPTSMIDQQLVMAARSGTAEAFDQLYRAHSGWVARMARSRASRDESTVADIVQEVFARAYDRLDQLREPAKFGAWIRTITHHVIVDHHRQAARWSPLDDESALRIEDQGPPVDVVLEARALAAVVGQLLSRLPPRDSMALLQAGVWGLSPRELGTELGISPGAAKVAVHRARKRLQVALRQESEHRS